MEVSCMLRPVGYNVDMPSPCGIRSRKEWSGRGLDSPSYAISGYGADVASSSVLSPSRELQRVKGLSQPDAANMEEEFRLLLIEHSESIDLEWTCDKILNGIDLSNGEGDEAEQAAKAADLVYPMELLPQDVVLNLNYIARCMMDDGHAKESFHVYVSIRKAVLEHSLFRLGFERIGVDDVQKMVWEDLELRIKNWNQVLKVAVRVLYPSEKALCYQVFAGMPTWAETSFLEAVKVSFMQLMNFAEAIATSRWSPEKLFTILDMYETLSDTLPSINHVFSDDLFMRMRFEASGTVMRLEEAARGIFAEFENAIRRESSKNAVPGGGIHPLTRYVMNYIWFLFSYIGPLKRLLGEKKRAPPALPDNDGESSDVFTQDDCHNNCADHLSPFGVQIVWLIYILEFNLDGKSKLYRDLPQTYFFLMNNVHYIVQKVRKSELSVLVGDDWVKKHAGVVRQHATNYIRLAWKNVLSYLREDGLNPSGGGVGGSFSARAAVKMRLKGFHSAFEELCRTQSNWVIPDPELREELRISIAEKLIPAYQSFLTRCQSCLGSGKKLNKYVKYSPEDLERWLLDLFEGTPHRKSFSAN